MTQENIPQEIGRIQILPYFRKPFFKRWSRRKVNRIMKGLANKVIDSWKESEKELRVEYLIERIKSEDPHKRGVKEIKVYDAGRDCLSANFEYIRPHPGPILNILEHTQGEIKYNPRYCMPGDIERLRRIGEK